MSTHTLGPPFIIDGPLPVPPPYRLTDVATIIEEPDEHFLNGVQVHSYPPDIPVSFDPCATGSDRIKAEGGIIPLPDFAAFTVYLAETCSPRSIANDADFRARAVASLTATDSHAVETELVGGVAIAANPYIEDTNLNVLNAGASTQAVTALGLLEDAIAATAKGGLIHVSPAAAVALANAYLIIDKGGKLFTLRGTPVVIGTGYVGSFPDSVGTLVENTAWIYATGPVQIRRTPVEIVPGSLKEALDRENNSVTYRAERHYVVDWDTDLQAGVLLDTTGCCGAGGGGDASAANQLLILAELQDILTELQGTITVDNAGIFAVQDAAVAAALAAWLLVHGNVPHDDPDSGNPVKVGGKAHTGVGGSVADGDRVDAFFSRVGAIGAAGQWDGSAGADSTDRLVSVFTPSQTAATGPNPLAVGAFLYNPYTDSWDRARANSQLTLLASAARSATTNTSDQQSQNWRGILLVLNVTANPGAAETLSVNVQVSEPAAAVYDVIADFGVVITAANGVISLLMAPGVAAADFDGDAAKAVQLTRHFRCTVTHSAAGSWTYSLRGQMLL